MGHCLLSIQLYIEMSVYFIPERPNHRSEMKRIKKKKTGMRKKAVHAKIDSLAPFDREKPTKFVFFFFFLDFCCLFFTTIEKWKRK